MTHQYCALYRAKNLVNGKEYYGISVDPKRRWKTHKGNAVKDCDQVFGRAIKKYGVDAFEFAVLMEELGDDAVVKCKDAEMLVIGMANSQVPYGYNITAGGDGTHGWVASEETKKRMRAAQKGKIISDATRKKISATLTGQVLKEGTKQKLRLRSLGRTASVETKIKMSVAQKGRVFSEDHCANMSAAHKGKVLSESHKKKIGDALRGVKQKKPHSLEVSKKHSEWMKKAYACGGVLSHKIKQVICIETGIVFANQKDAAEWASEKGVGWMVGAVATGKRKTAYGHTWKFMEKEIA